MLLRRTAIAVFAIALSLVVACGHQVTPNPKNSDLAGDIVLKFRVNGTLDFTDYTYAVIIDTCAANPSTPYPQAFNSTYFSYSYAFFIGGSFGTALPQLIQYSVTPNSNNQIIPLKINEGPSLEQFIPNDNGQGNEFELVFNRAELDDADRLPQPCANLPAISASASPSASAGSSPTPSPIATSTATLAPGASPSPSPTASAPFAYPTTTAQQYWYFNFFTIQSNTILDSLGIGGPTDTTFSSGAVNTSITQDVPIFKATGGTQPSNPSAQLNGGDIQNYE